MGRAYGTLAFVIMGWQKRLGLPISYSVAKRLAFGVRCVHAATALVWSAGMLYVLAESWLQLNRIF